MSGQVVFGLAVAAVGILLLLWGTPKRRLAHEYGWRDIVGTAMLAVGLGWALRAIVLNA